MFIHNCNVSITCTVLIYLYSSNLLPFTMYRTVICTRVQTPLTTRWPGHWVTRRKGSVTGQLVSGSHVNAIMHFAGCRLYFPYILRIYPFNTLIDHYTDFIYLTFTFYTFPFRYRATSLIHHGSHKQHYLSIRIITTWTSNNLRGILAKWLRSEASSKNTGYIQLYYFTIRDASSLTDSTIWTLSDSGLG